jgi:hypothetical protein
VAGSAKRADAARRRRKGPTKQREIRVTCAVTQAPNDEWAEFLMLVYKQHSAISCIMQCCFVGNNSLRTLISSTHSVDRLRLLSNVNTTHFVIYRPWCCYICTNMVNSHAITYAFDVISAPLRAWVLMPRSASVALVKEHDLISMTGSAPRDLISRVLQVCTLHAMPCQGEHVYVPARAFDRGGVGIVK